MHLLRRSYPGDFEIQTRRILKPVEHSALAEPCGPLPVLIYRDPIFMGPMTELTGSYYIGIDVGTGSVRACIVSKGGHIIASSTQATKTWRDPHDHRIFEQSTTDIWSCTCFAIKDCLSQSCIAKEAVKGIGFDATCSLAVTDFKGEPIVITKGHELGKSGERNVILWADHRAEKEAELINGTGSVVLDFVGGKMSVEMEIPKILWLKNHMSSECFSRCQFFDLPDYLTYKATSDSSRSACSLTCKCSYVPDSGWQKEFFRQIGLGDLVDREYASVGGRKEEEVLCAGMPVGAGLSRGAAEQMGLKEGTPVGSGIIDAYAGWLGTVAARYTENGVLSDVVPTLGTSQSRLAAIAGTSTCHIVQTRKDIFVSGVWGPYKDPIFNGWWTNEGGQSSTGQLIDFILTTHPAYPELVERSESEQKDIYHILDTLLENLRLERGVESLTELTKDLHIYPDFHGNRSPIADPQMRGAMVGLELSSSLNDLALKFHATLLSIAFQTRHILDTLNDAGHTITSMFISGGQAKNKDLMRMLAEVCNIGIVLPEDGGAAVVLGSAMLGRLAHEITVASTGISVWNDEQAERLWDIMAEMTPLGTILRPQASNRENRILRAKYKIFLEAIDVQKRWRRKMEESTA